MSDDTLLSSEQALDDYFNSLLFEDDELQALVKPGIDDTIPAEPEPEPDVAGSNYQLEPMVQPEQTKGFYHPTTAEIEIPNLEDVERLLKQLESSNPVDELQLASVMEQNTLEIAKATQTHVVEEEIQDWVPEPYVTPEVEMPLEVETEPQVDVTIEAVSEPSVEVEPQVELETQQGGGFAADWQSTQREQAFQVLYFDVNGVTFAVPLDELGGIHRLAELNHLIGRPEWYLGLQSSREAQLDVVDTAKWVMAEKLVDDSYKERYQYIVMLGASKWGLASTQLMGTELLDPEKVRWREMAGKRPWLAGMVKEKMCALIHVEALIAMLNAGLDVKALDK
ncbi:chemotaxis protein CheW [Vibrio ponticus]|uniref:Chemotaxis protein CheW n=1 Tax=Vibrio ponticus TaxID=265668 RepID=A0A3N3E496_9VIBR|nr:chemotaxis protein CheW [Vibrio ponticus]ROV61561.1 chemotaxis protein CheW [Vibrio ponticus]